MTYGRWDCEARVLYVDVTHHASDREVRATVLHEMIHAVLGRGGHHDRLFVRSTHPSAPFRKIGSMVVRGDHRVDPSRVTFVAVGTPVNPTPPAQIRTCRIAAYGSYLGCMASNRTFGCGCRILALGIQQSTNR
jgi:hypothetical protein